MSFKVYNPRTREWMSHFERNGDILTVVEWTKEHQKALPFSEYKSANVLRCEIELECHTGELYVTGRSDD